VSGETFFFGDAMNHVQDGPEGRRAELDPAAFRLRLGRDPVLPCPWSYDRYVPALAWIGSGKAEPRLAEQMKYGGAWLQNDNHDLEVWLPWRIGFVRKGNHSLAAGILAAEGEVVPYAAYDMGFLLDELKCDGCSYILRRTGEPVAPVDDLRRAAVFEIGRLIRDHGERIAGHRRPIN
jgi:hypothetical protein